MEKLSKNFSREEFACKDQCGFDTVDVGLLDLIQRVRDHYGKPVIIHCACRCLAHNAALGREDTSQHTKARAIDFHIESIPHEDIYIWIDNGVLKGKCGLGIYPWGVHIDNRTDGPARWRG